MNVGPSLRDLQISWVMCSFLRCLKDRGSFVPVSLVLPPSSPSPRTHFLSMFPQMMIMLGAICAIIVVVIVSKYR